jgi:hypothetical protein
VASGADELALRADELALRAGELALRVKWAFGAADLALVASEVAAGLLGWLTFCADELAPYTGESALRASDSPFRRIGVRCPRVGVEGGRVGVC